MNSDNESSYEVIKSVNDKLTLFLFKEEAIIYSALSNSLHLLNSLGIYAWLLFEEGLPKKEVLALCKETQTGKASVLESEGSDTQAYSQNSKLELLIEELEEIFQTAQLTKPKNDTGSDATQEELWLNEIKFHNECIPTFLESPKYLILDSVFYFHCPDKHIENLLTPIIEPFKLLDLSSVRNAVNTERKEFYIEIKHEKDNNYRLAMNGYLFSWSIPEQRLLSFLLDRLRKLAFTYSDYFIAAHAAVLKNENACLMLPAVSYSGKSTLSAALIAKRYQYLSDEMAVIDKDYNARAVPLGLGLKSGSWNVLASLMPELDSQQEMERWDGVSIKYMPEPYDRRQSMTAEALSETRNKITHVVFPTYQRGSSACLDGISIPQAVYRLYQAGYTQGKDLSLASLNKILIWLSVTPAFSFRFDQLEEAALCLGKLK